MDEQKLLSDFGGRVRTERLKINLSQEELAFECGLDRTYISSIERGKRNVSLINIHKIAAALQVPAPDLLQEGRAKK
jgi:transcriptional regulator with XRE-family HTH domain